MVKRVPDALESRPVYPIKMTNLVVTSDVMTKLMNQFELSPNECLFWLLASSINQSKPDNALQIMCLHNMRKTLGKQNEVGGDYSCFTEPLSLSDSPDTDNNAPSSWPAIHLLPSIKSYFQQVRDNVSNLSISEECKSFQHIWMYDAWTGTNIVRPWDNTDIELDIPALMSCMSW